MTCLALPRFCWRSASADDDRLTAAGPDADNLFRSRGPVQEVNGQFSGGSGQRRGGGGDLVAVPGLRCPRQAQRIARVARDDVEVEVEHRLPRVATARVDEVDAVGPQALTQ